MRAKSLDFDLSIEPWHGISNNVVCATSKASDQPAHTHSCLNILWVLATDWTSFGVSKLKRRLHYFVWVYTCQNTTLLEITWYDSIHTPPYFMYEQRRLWQNCDCTAGLSLHYSYQNHMCWPICFDKPFSYLHQGKSLWHISWAI